MNIQFHPHALQRLVERGVTTTEVEQTILKGEKFSAKHGRTGFRHNFSFHGEWKGKVYRNKQVEVFAIWNDNCWLVITTISKYF